MPFSEFMFHVLASFVAFIAAGLTSNWVKQRLERARLGR